VRNRDRAIPQSNKTAFGVDRQSDTRGKGKRGKYQRKNAYSSARFFDAAEAADFLRTRL
jgi:hypothetical protein